MHQLGTQMHQLGTQMHQLGTQMHRESAGFLYYPHPVHLGANAEQNHLQGK